jgi:hypothetical protein
VQCALQMSSISAHRSDHLHGPRLRDDHRRRRQRQRRRPLRRQRRWRHDVDDDVVLVSAVVGARPDLAVGVEGRRDVGLLVRLLLLLLGVGGDLRDHLHLRHGAVLLGVPVHEVEPHLGQAEQQAQHVGHLHTSNTYVN